MFARGVVVPRTRNADNDSVSYHVESSTARSLQIGTGRPSGANCRRRTSPPGGSFLTRILDVVIVVAVVVVSVPIPIATAGRVSSSVVIGGVLSSNAMPPGRLCDYGNNDTPYVSVTQSPGGHRESERTPLRLGERTRASARLSRSLSSR